MKSFKTPTNEQIEKAVALLGAPQHYRYFLDKLENPKWITPLRGKGFFSSPPKNIPVEGGIRYPHWQAAKYLARMAEHEPKLVADILSEVETDNPNILFDMVEAALKMPVSDAVPLVQKITQLIDNGIEFYLFHQEELIQIVQRLAKETGTHSHAFGLARAYLFPKVQPESRSQRHEEHHFFKALESLTPVMVSLRPKETLHLLSEKLLEAIKAKKLHSDIPFDYSYIWRPAIEEHEQNRTYDLAGKFVTPLRDAAERAVRDRLLPLDDVLKLVRSFRYLVFQRLAVHLINEFGETNPTLVQETAMDKSLFDDYEFKHEYAMLVGKRFDLLKPEQKDTFFGWVDEGPDMSGFDDVGRSSSKREPTDEDQQNRVRRWQYNRLWWIRNHLEGERKDKFDQMQTKYGTPELADLNARTSSHWGTDSPISSDELADLSFVDVLDKVVTWRPDEQRSGFHLAEGLQNTFGNYVKQHVETCANEAKLLIGKPAMFVHPFISAMCDAVNEDKAIKYDPVFELCQWVVKQPADQDTRQIPSEEHDFVDKDWQWCRNQIGDFAKKCCEKNVPFEYRKTIWSILEPLIHDPDENYIVDTKEEDVRIKDFSNHSLNNPQGKAIRAVFEYARWVAKQFSKKSNDGRDVVSGGLKSMPEVREVLESGLKSGEHDSFAVRAAYGTNTGLMYWIDRNWLGANVDRIYNLSSIETSSESAFGWAAWNSFLVWTPPHVEYFTLLQKQFQYAVDQYRDIVVEEGGSYSPAGRLAQHLIVLYGRGQLGLDDHDSILRRFLSKSPQKVRSYAMSFVGESFHSEEEEIEDAFLKEAVERFMRLWEWYWPEIGSKDENPAADIFGYWYICKCFDRKWALGQLAEYAQCVHLLEPDHELPKQLATDAKQYPGTALSIINGMIDADQEGWRVRTWLDSITAILEHALQKEGGTRQAAESLIDRLGRKGFTDLGELLREDGRG